MKRSRSNVVRLTAAVPAPEAPAHLPPRAREEWDRLAPVLARAGKLDASTAPILAELCSTYAMIEEYDAVLLREGYLVKGKDGFSKPHPVSRPRAQAASRIVAFTKRLKIAAPDDAPRSPADDRLARLGLLD